MNTLVICSGGLDSVTLAWKVASEAKLAGLISFNYGQRHLRELDAAASCAQQLDVPHDIVDLRALASLLPGSALTDPDIDVPLGHYQEQSMRSTVVPNRNPIMMSIAFGVASARALDAVALAVHGGDHFIYPDCRPGFIHAFAQMEQQALEGVHCPQLQAPFVNGSKADIVRIGYDLKVPFADTWSCYAGNDVHCGRCGTCVERREAFQLADVTDPTTYADPHSAIPSQP
ncbi:7-cyano-7-deazaguanine synthase QueC [Granulosicoccus antarcticus]|uniref:7-cyano-7-deazaguanine synthase n=1 Tax=Granulosicoccus antarcticus IMCC3135 TaxID=1192854 RepID=A0A2Z2NWD2_9GAMM|nr:7-cyano-7-deazaguanine synthase QueC [Granulosicoccus antarcticus]ASJ74361.1 7-cyano-7-deazaguanine synthase [Granulosicoccus antarcticus IMCC3135]